MSELDPSLLLELLRLDFFLAFTNNLRCHVIQSFCLFHILRNYPKFCLKGERVLLHKNKIWEPLDLRDHLAGKRMRGKVYIRDFHSFRFHKAIKFGGKNL